VRLECLLGPYCGDGKVEPGKEDCDNGKNDDVYGATSGCGPDCKLPARCGDSIVQTQFDEECDDGSSNLTTTDPTPATAAAWQTASGAYCATAS